MGDYKPTPIEGYSYQSWFPNRYQVILGALPLAGYVIGLKSRKYSK